MDKFLESNMFARIISILLAVTLWLYVVSEAGRPLVPTTMTSRPFDDVEVKFVNVGENLKVVGPSVTVDVLVEGDRNVVLNLKKNDISAAADLSNLGAGQHEVPIQVQTPEAVRLISVNPDRVSVMLEPTVTRKMPLEIEIQGFPAEGFVAGDPKPETEFIRVTGTALEVSRISRTVVVITLNGESETIRRILPVQIEDLAGASVDGVTVMPEVVEVVVPISPAPGEQDTDTSQGGEETSQSV